MEVDVADVLAPMAGSVDRLRHRANDLLAVRRHLHAVIRVARGRVAVDRRVDRRAARPRAIFALEDDHPRALAEHEAVAPFVERARRLLGPIVVRERDRLHPREAEDHAGRDARVGAARQDHLRFAAAQQRRRVADGIRGARASARQHVADAVQPKRDRNLARHHPNDRHGNRVRRHLPAALDEEVVVLPFADVDPAAAAADHDTSVRLADAQSGVRPRLARRDDADERRARIALRIRAIARIPHVVAVERRHVVDRDAGHGRRDAASELRRVELRDRARRAAAAADRVPEALASDAVRRDDADPRDDDARAAGVTHAAIVAPTWRALWDTIAGLIADDQRNASNRFATSADGPRSQTGLCFASKSSRAARSASALNRSSSRSAPAPPSRCPA